MAQKSITAVLYVILLIAIVNIPEVSAHLSGCHLLHSCPPDSGKYTCGDRGYCSQCPDNEYCKTGKAVSIQSSIIEKAKETIQKPICKTDSEKKCYKGNVYWYDSCGQRQERYQTCDKDSCDKGNCKTVKSTETSSFTSADEIVGKVQSLPSVKYSADFDNIKRIDRKEIISKLPTKFAGFADFAIRTGSCLQEKGAVSGMVYVGGNSGFSTAGIFGVVDKREVTNVENYVRCIVRYHTGLPLSIADTAPSKITLHYCKWSIKDRFEILHVYVAADKDKMGQEICTVLGTCSTKCKTFYIEGKSKP